ncbi:MAG TPA: PhzF family phenazine biosynthesis protein [Caulobacteraceae bacterium]
MRQWTVDAFAAAPFKGNPACVVEPLDAWPDTAWMQSLAAENNQAETAFLLKTADVDRFGLRWFTPKVEVPLCGHATLASAHTLFRELGNSSPAIRFETLKSGILIVRRLGERIEMDFPADPPRQIQAPEGLADAMGAEPVEVWIGQYLIAVLNDETAVRNLAPNLAKVEPIGAEASAGRGNLSVVAKADADRDYAVVSRFFAPGSGIAEDPTTGSAHCMLAPLYAGKLGQPNVRFHQAFPGRGGDVEAEMAGDRVLLRGSAVTVVESVLRL